MAKVKKAESRGEAASGHQPYVAESANMHEFTWSAVLMGSLLGIVFGASSLYLVLKVGLTVSASIPVAVLSITLFRGLSKVFKFRRATILENNIVQTAGSAGESIAFGVGVTMPALMLLGFEMDIGRVMVVSVLGGLLGILMMIPLRRAFIVKQHGLLKYPEGTACADVLIVGEEGGSSAKTVFIGFGLAFVYQVLMQGMKLWQEAPQKALSWFKGAVPAIEVNPTLLGVGYIIGTRISCVMVAGGVLSSFVLIPAIRLFGDDLAKPLYPAKILIREMDEDAIWHNYVLYIGAGAVAAGGIISLFQSLPLIIGSIRSGVRDLLASRKDGAESTARTDRDIPLWVVGLGSVLLVGAIWGTSALHAYVPWVPQLEVNWLGAIMIVLFGFFFVTVSSRLTGEIGSSSNPISGMTVATLILTCLIFFLLNRTAQVDQLAALSIAAVVCIAASNGGTTSQDLKTGFLIGATPKWQQWAIVVGSLSSALVIGGFLILLNNASTVYTAQHLPRLEQPLDVSKLPDTEKAPGDDVLYHVWHPQEDNVQGVKEGKYLVDDAGRIQYFVDPGINGELTRRDDNIEVTKFKAPKAQLMRLITSGILDNKLPWSLVLLGVSIAIVLELSGVPSLPFAVGVYLPLSSSTPIFVGGLVRYLADWRAKKRGVTESESDSSPGVLLSTGFIAGGAIGGMVIAFMILAADNVSSLKAIPRAMESWQYRTMNVEETDSPEKIYERIARDELRLSPNDDDLKFKDSTIDPKAPDAAQQAARLKDAQERLKARRLDIKRLTSEIDDLNRNLLVQAVSVPAGAVVKMPGHPVLKVEQATNLNAVANRLNLTDTERVLLLQLNRSRLKMPAPKNVAAKTALPDFETIDVPTPFELVLPTEKTIKPEKEITLGDLAKQEFGQTDRAAALWELNKERLSLPEKLPKGAAIKIPQHSWPALVAFGVLTLLLLLVGAGLLLQPPAVDKPVAVTKNPTPSTSGQPDRTSSNRPNDKFKDKRRDEDDDA